MRFQRGSGRWLSGAALALAVCLQLGVAGAIKDGTLPICLVDAQNIGLLIMLSLVVSALLFMHLIQVLNLRWLVPEALATLLCGLFIGKATDVFAEPLGISDVETLFRMNTSFFFLVLYPAIVFSAGYHMDRGLFFQYIFPIICYAFVGTLISVAVIAQAVYWLGQTELSLEITQLDSLFYGIIVSAIDPVASLSVFDNMRVTLNVSTLVFGESVVNDVVILTVYRVFAGFTEDVTPLGYLEALGEISYITLLSVLVGVVFGLGSVLMTRYLNLQHHLELELALFASSAYFPYLIAEKCHLSAIVTIFCTSLIMGHYLHQNLSSQAQITVLVSVDILAFLCETLIFGYLGVAVFNFNFQVVDWRLIGWLLLVMVIARAMHIFPLTLLANIFNSEKIPLRNQIIMWLSGGMRGAIAFALAIDFLLIRTDKGIVTDGSHALFSSTLAICLVSLFVFGNLTLPLVKLLNVDIRPPGKFERQQPLPHWLQKLKNFEEKYLAPWLVRKNNMESQVRQLNNMSGRSSLANAETPRYFSKTNVTHLTVNPLMSASSRASTQSLYFTPKDDGVLTDRESLGGVGMVAAGSGTAGAHGETIDAVGRGKDKRVTVHVGSLNRSPLLDNDAELSHGKRKKSAHL